LDAEISEIQIEDEQGNKDTDNTPDASKMENIEGRYNDRSGL
jgi:hypothetical protein